MKYKEIEKIEVRSGKIYPTNKGLFIAKKINDEGVIIRFNPNTNKWEHLYVINYNNVYEWCITKDFLIISFENETTTFYTLNKEKVLELDKQLSFTFIQENDLYIYMKSDGNLYRFNKVKLTIEYFPLATKNLQLFCLLQDNLIFRFRGDQLFLYKNSISTIELSWQLDLDSLFPNQEDITIKSVKEYQGSLIVATSVATLRLSAEDGSVIWINNGYVRTIEIVGNTGYICTGLSLLKINLDNGEESGYGWEQNRLPDFTYKGQEYYPAGHEVVYHDGLLWYSVCSSGESFLIAINPENGNYEWIHHVDTNDQTDAPQFYEDKMFLWDTGNMLHIYEKEK